MYAAVIDGIFHQLNQTLDVFNSEVTGAKDREYLVGDEVLLF